MRVKELRQRRADLVAQARAIIDEAASKGLETIEGEKAEEFDRVKANLAEVEQTLSMLEDTADWERGLETRGQVERPDAVENQTQGFTDSSDFLLAVRAASLPGGVRDPRLTFVEGSPNNLQAAQGMSQGVGSEGGFAVPPSFSSSIWDGMNESPDNLLGRTDQYPITGESITFPANAETSRATGSRYGGVRGYWISEADQITGSAPKLRKVRLEPQELAVLVYATEKSLFNSAGALERYVRRSAIDEINFLVGDAIVNGDGAGKPLGLMNAGCKVAVAKETSQVADTIVAANISKMWVRLLPAAKARAVWLMNGECEAQLDGLELGSGGQLVYVPSGGLADRALSTLKGRPVIETPFNPQLGDEGDLILTDLGSYATAVHRGIRADTSMHVRFEYAEQAFRFMFEIDGKPWLAAPITPYKGTSTKSTVVTLAARA
ncbi:MAG: phage major capsid protein [Planctomycetes bacterium]|nr:phage major capsid protein [Planctomycetota bacterium]